MITRHAQFAKRLPSWLYKLGAQTWIDKKFPRHLFIETTATCNLTCDYCPREKIRRDMDFRLFQKIVDEAAIYGARSFSLHLFGEPTLYPRLLDSIAYIKQKNRANVILLTTNGTKLNECVDDLRQSGVDQVLWSWRPEPKWTPATVRKLKDWRAFTVRIIEEVTPEHIQKEYARWPRVERRKLHNYGGNIDLLDYQMEMTSAINVNNAGSKQPRWPCYHLFLAPAVAWNGKFLLCCADPKQKEIFGDISNETVHEAWQRLERVRASHLAGKYEGICKDCDVWRQYPDLFYSWQRTGSSSGAGS